MKPNTEKAIIIIVAIAIISAVVYFVFFRNRSSKASSMVNLLPITDDQKAEMKAKVAEILANNANWNGWSKAEIERKAAENGYTYDQWVVVEAAYALYYTSNWSLFDKIGKAVKSL